MSRGLKSVGIFLAIVVIFSLSHHSLGTNSGSTTSTTGQATTTTGYSSTCQASDLSASFVGGQGAAGTIYGQWAITKNSGANCVLFGYPVVTYQDSSGAVLPIKILHSPEHTSYFADSAANKAPALVAMHAGSVAHIDFSYNDVPIGNSTCPTVAAISLQLRSGDTTIALTPGPSFAPCAGKTLISPYF